MFSIHYLNRLDAETILYNVTCGQMIAASLLQCPVLAGSIHSCPRPIFSPSITTLADFTFQLQFIVLDNRGIRLLQGLPRFSGLKMQFPE